MTFPLFGLKKEAAGIAEPLAQFASSGLAEPVAGVVGTGVGAVTRDPAAGAHAVEKVKEWGTYQPRTQEGQANSEKIAGLVGQVLDKVGAQEAQHYWRTTVVPALHKNMGPVVGSMAAAAGLAMLNLVGERLGPLPKNVPKGMRGAVGGRGRQYPDFDPWFAGSKVVDEHGNPKVVYHGTTKDVSQFGLTHDVGYHFGTPEQTDAFTMHYGQAKEGANVIPAYLRMQRPLELEFDFTKWPDDHRVLTRNFSFAERLDEIADAIGPNVAQKKYIRARKAAEKLDSLAYKYAANIDKYDWRDLRDEKATKEYWKSLSDYIQESGHDGVVYPNEVEGEGLSYAVFRPENIKSAIGNKGTFSPTSPDLTE